MTKLLAVLASLAFCLAGCATAPMAPAAEDARGKTFEAPPPGQAALYLVRQGIYFGAPLTSITVGQRAVGTLTMGTWMRVDMPPGRYDVRAVAALESAAGTVDLAAGETRFLSVHMGATRLTVTEIPAAEGRAAVMQGQRAAEIR